jgi:hypothetical protein
VRFVLHVEEIAGEGSWGAKVKARTGSPLSPPTQPGVLRTGGGTLGRRDFISTVLLSKTERLRLDIARWTNTPPL